MRNILFLLLALMLTLSACGGGESSFNSDNGGGGGGVAGAAVDITLTINGGVFADGQSQANISVKVSQSNGQPLANQAVRFSFSAAEETIFGALDKTTAQTDANGQVTAIFTASKTPGSANIRVTVGTEIDEVVTINTQIPVPNVVALTTTAVGQDVVLNANVTSLSNLGNALALANESVSFTAIEGSLENKICGDIGKVTLAPSSVLTNNQGLANAVAFATEAGEYCVEVRAGAIRQQRLVNLRAKDPSANATLSIATNTRGGVIADGQSQATFTATLRNSLGAPLANQNISISFAQPDQAAFGSLSQVLITTDANGQGTVNFTASSRPGSVGIRFAFGSQLVQTVNVTTTVPVANTVVLAQATVGQDVVLTANIASLSNVGNALPLADATVTFSAISGVVNGQVCGNPANVTIAPTSTLTNSNGRAQSVVSAREAGNYCLQAATANNRRAEILLALVAKDPSANATLSIATNTRGGVIADGQSQATFTATLRNSLGAPLANQNISISFAQPDQAAFGSLSQVLITTDANGQGTVNFTASSRPGSVGIRFAFGSQLVQTVNVTTTAPTASSITLAQGAVINNSVVLTATAQSRTNLGVAIPLAGETITFSAIPGVLSGSLCQAPANATLSPASLSTNNNGEAQVVLSATQAGDYCIQATAENGSFFKLLVSVTQSVTPATLNIFLNKPTLNTGAGDRVRATVLVRNSQTNNILVGQPVTFSVDSGELVVVRGTTDAAGTALAEITSSTNFTNRNITLTARANNQAATLTFPVEGTRLALRNSIDLLAVGATRTLDFDLFDGSNSPIPFVSVAARSSDSTVFSVNPSSQILNIQGDGRVQLTGVGAGRATVTLESTSLNARLTTAPVVVDDTVFDITVANNVVLGAQSPLSILWTKGGVPVSGATVTINTTRGEFTDGAGNSLGNTQVLTTNAVGRVSSFIRANSSGEATILATGNAVAPVATASATVQVLFTSNTPQVLALTATPDTVGVGGESATIRALVTDNNNNAVSNFTVSFNLNDPSGGTLNASTILTNAQGVASAIYRSGRQGSPKDGVVITATVLDATGNPLALSRSVRLSVAEAQVFVRLGTSRDITIPSLTTYADPWSVLVTDAVGGGLANQPVVLRVTPERYRKGYWRKDPSPPQSFKLWVPEVTATCESEDRDQDGVLDPGEDVNGDGVLTPGNVAAVPGRVTTQDGTGNLAIGFQEFNVSYSKNRGAWTDVILEASTSVSGSEFRTLQAFTLEVATQDVTDENSPPPSNPYGRSISCACNLTDEALAAIEVQRGLPLTRPECVPLP